VLKQPGNPPDLSLCRKIKTHITPGILVALTKLEPKKVYSATCLLSVNNIHNGIMNIPGGQQRISPFFLIAAKISHGTMDLYTCMVVFMVGLPTPNNTTTMNSVATFL